MPALAAAGVSSTWKLTPWLGVEAACGGTSADGDGGVVPGSDLIAQSPERVKHGQVYEHMQAWGTQLPLGPAGPHAHSPGL